MDANEYLLERMVRERLETDRARARQLRLARRARQPGRAPRWRSVLGHALVRLGRALAGQPPRRARHA